ncbi:MAG: glycosyltransferase [Balneolaceae bacterium]|nr:glycosyltransferase [Balneolaceae bacterium]
MHQQPLLSIIFTVYNQRDIIESTLNAILEIESFPFELIIIDDASTDGSDDAIQSLLDYHQHDHAFYFDHEKTAGRANCLNEAIQQASGKVLWTPSSINQLDEKMLKETAESLAESDVLFSLQKNGFPESNSILQWINFIKKSDWPKDGAFLWNRNNIAASSLFFNPVLSQFHGVELAARLSTHSYPLETEPLYTTAELEKHAVPKDKERLELVFLLLRSFEWTDEERNQVLHLVESFSTSGDSGPAVRSHEALLEEAQQMKEDGRFSPALELVEHVLNDQPGHPEAKQIKLEILEKKRRFVEASELKHELKVSEDKPANKTPAEDIVTSIIIPTSLYGKAGTGTMPGKPL